MAPNITSAPTGVLFEGETLDEKTPIIEEPKEQYKVQIVWRNVIVFSYLHISAIYGLYLAITSAKLLTLFFSVFLFMFGGFGVTGGAHRLWSHRSYKAKWPLQLLIMIANCVAVQDSVIDWARDHRLHHKYSETNADPHNAKRGFFFAHIGWLLCRKHPDVKIKGKGIDISDLKNNPILAFQKKFYLPLIATFCVILPTVIPVYCWNETWMNAYHIPFVLRYMYLLHSAWLVNSAAHLFGNKPYDKHINPAENILVEMATFGEGWHNYHHVFPWDYKASELGNDAFNFATPIINFFARHGLAYDLKQVSPDVVRQRVNKTGDGSHNLWGWGDKDQTQEDRERAYVTNTLKK